MSHWSNEWSTVFTMVCLLIGVWGLSLVLRAYHFLEAFIDYHRERYRQKTRELEASDEAESEHP